MSKTKKDLVSLIISKTLIFIVVVLLVSVFKSIFGEENSLIGVTSIVLMLVLLQLNLTLHPFKNLLGLIVLNLIFGLSAFLIVQNMILGLLLNFVIMLFIGYHFSYELKKPINVLIALHYILILVNPVSASQLPLRLLSLVAGAFMIMAVQLVANKNKLIKSRKKLLTSIIDNILLKIELLKTNEAINDVNITLSTSMNQLKSDIFDSGKSDTHLTECGLNTITILSCLEKINSIIDNIKVSNLDVEFLNEIAMVLYSVKDEKLDITISGQYKKKSPNSMELYDLENIIEVLNIEMKPYSKVSNKQQDIKGELSIQDEFKSLHVQKRLINLKSTRLTYGIRLGLVVSLTYFFVNFFNIAYGEWAVYTVFVLAQPHSEYTISKSKKRIIGTLIGSVIIAVLFNLVNDPSTRTLMLIAAGYLMSYMTDYRDMVIFITFSAVASAAISTVNPNVIILNRVAFIIIGIIISLIANKFILPRKLSDEEENLNNMQKQSSKKMIGEVLLNEGSKNESTIGILSLLPALIDLRIDYLKQNGLDMDTTLIDRNKILANDLYQIHLLDKFDNNYSNVFSKIKEYIKTTNSIEILESKIEEEIKSTDNTKEKYLFTKILTILNELHNWDYTKEEQTDLYQFLTIFS